MRYVNEVSVHLPRESVLRLLTDRDNDMRWRPDLEMCELIAGEPGRLGAQTRCLYRQVNGGVRETVEHLEANRLPDALELKLVSRNNVEHQLHTFADDEDSATRWTVECTVEEHHNRFSLRRHPSILEQDNRRAMESFKAFAEGPAGRALLASHIYATVPDSRIHMRNDG